MTRKVRFAMGEEVVAGRMEGEAGRAAGWRAYRDAVAAVDEGGNESAACAAVEVVVP